MKLFSTIDSYEMTRIMDAVKPVEYKAGAYIIREVKTRGTHFIG